MDSSGASASTGESNVLSIHRPPDPMRVIMTDVPARRPLAPHRVLIVDHDAALALALRYTLELDGHQVEIARDGARGVLQARGAKLDVVVIGQALLESEGELVFQGLRLEQPAVPFVIVGTRPLPASRLPGFRLGVDEFILRPVSVFEMHGRIELVLRRRGVPEPALAAPPPEPVLAFGDIEIDPATQVVRKGGREVELRPREFDLLMALVRRNGRVTSRMELLQDVWGYTDSVVSRTVDSHVAELRRKLEDDARNPRHIFTLRKRGYRLQR